MKPKAFGVFLREAREKKQFTLRDIETLSREKDNYTAISNSYLSQVEQGDHVLACPDRLRTLADILDVKYAQLLFLAGYINMREFVKLSK